MIGAKYVLKTVQKYWGVVAYDHHNSRKPEEWLWLSLRFMLALVAFGFGSFAGLLGLHQLQLVKTRESLAYAFVDSSMFLVEGVAVSLVVGFSICVIKGAIAAEQQGPTRYD